MTASLEKGLPLFAAMSVGARHEAQQIVGRGVVSHLAETLGTLLELIEPI